MFNLTLLRKSIIGIIWLGFTAYVLWLAPLDRPETYPIVKSLLTFQVSKVNAYLFAIFWLMGVLPMIYACMMFADARMQKLPAWLYFIAANATGILGLTPYLLIRDRNTDFKGMRDSGLRFFDSHSTAVGLSIITIALIAWALIMGNWQDFLHQWKTIPFVHLITLDFCFMNLFLPLSTLVDDDLVRHQQTNYPYQWLITLLPLVGMLVYLCQRPPLPASNQ